MDRWITLRPRSVFWPKLAHATNIGELSELAFRYKGGRLVVELGGRRLVETDGRDSLRVGEMMFLTRYSGQAREALVSLTLTLAFGPPLATDKQRDQRTLSSSRGADEAYAIYRHHGWSTCCEVRSLGSRVDPQVMLGCLAYFWVEADKDRRWT